MSASKDQALFAMLIGTEDDPIPALRVAHQARVAADNRVNAERINDAINNLIDAEVEVNLSLRGVLDTPLDQLLTRHSAAVQACQSILSAETSHA